MGVGAKTLEALGVVMTLVLFNSFFDFVVLKKKLVILRGGANAAKK